MLHCNQEKCTACGACVQICPQKCIMWEEKELGFLYPHVDTEACIRCDACNAVCPIDRPMAQVDFPQEAYAAVHRDQSIVLQSSSGGLFTALAQEIFLLGGVVYGCAFTKDLRAVSARAENETELRALRGSKYAQCDTKDIFWQIKKDLSDGKWVLFSGTPCHIAALHAFLKKDCERLVCVDMVCHGIVSQHYFDDYIRDLEDQVRGKIHTVSFRDKANGGWTPAGSFSGNYKKDGRAFTKPINYFNSYYFSHFLKGEILRKSCYQCPYATLHRVGDISLADFWGAERIALPFSIKNGCSLVLVNTEKGKEIFSRLDVHRHAITPAQAAKYNRQLRGSAQCPDARKTRIAEYRERDFDLIRQNYKKENIRQNIVGKIKYKIPLPLKNLLLKIKYTLKR